MSNEPMEWHLSSEVFEENAMLATAISEHVERLIAEQAEAGIGETGSPQPGV